LLKSAGEYSPEEGLTFNVLSVFDRDNWVKPSSSKNINIALYHGAIQGCLVGSDFSLDHGEDDLSIFSDFDYAMLGDIHKIQSLDPNNRIWYAGSTIQQNFGESRLKGYLMWNIHSKDKHNVERRLFQSPRPFITVKITEDGKLPNEDVPTNARLRLVCEHNIPRARITRLQDYAKSKWSPYSVQLLNKSQQTISDLEDQKSSNVRDQSVFDEYMEEFLATKNTDEDIRQRSMEIAREYFKKNVSQDNSRNVTWKLDKMTWDYLFNYGKGNSLDFSKLNGLVGIFGKNYSGKSSIIDAALFGLFNTTSKGERRNVHVINQNQQQASCKLEISIGNDAYEINRSLEKTTGKSKGREVERAKTELDFKKITLGSQVESRNGVSRNKTDEEIQKTFGTIRDFMMTSFSAQNDSLGFIQEGSTRRKEILAKFLDLEIFDEMHKDVKSDSAEMRGYIKHLNGVDWERKLSRAEAEYSEILEEIEAKQMECQKHEGRLLSLQSEQTLINDQVEAASQRDIDIDTVRQSLLETQESLTIYCDELEGLSTEMNSKRSKIEDLTLLLPSWLESSDQARSDLDSLQTIKDGIEQITKSLNKSQRQQVTLQSKIDMLHDHEYDPDCEFCSNNEFVKHAESAKVTIVTVAEELENFRSELQEWKTKQSSFNETYLRAEVELYEVKKTTLNSLNQEVRNMTLQRENIEGKVSLAQHKVESLEADIEYYNENIEAYENLSSLRGDLKAINQTIALKQKACKSCQAQLLELMSEKGSTKRTIEEATEGIQKIKDAERDYIAYDLFAQATHTNGISYQVIKSMLSVINSEIASVLSSIVDFEVFFDNDGDSLEIYLKHPNYDPRPLSMGSGAEKTIASMAIRLSLISVSSLPKSSIFILDEPATALDAEHMEGFVRLLQMVKAQFKTVLLITHLEYLKDVVDTTIEIDKSDGYAQVNL
jgi:exonuclease SbcC